MGMLDDMTTVAESEVLLIAGNLNGYIVEDRRGFEEVMGAHGFGVKNQERERILELCQSKEMRVTNMMFKKDREKKIPYKSGGTKTKIDFILLRKVRGIWVRDCKVIPGEACLTQHRLLRADIHVTNLKRKKKLRGEKKYIKEWKLKDEKMRRQFEVKVQHKINM